MRNFRRFVLGTGLSLLGATGSARAQTPIILGQSYTLESKVLGQTRLLNVYLPAGYEESKTERYPVLYLLDGGVAEDFVHVAGIASLAVDWRGLRPFILVGIAGIDRYHELIFPSTVEAERKKLPTHGASAQFREYITKEVKPFVASHFRVTDESVLMGESAAGMFTVEMLLRQPELFTGYVAISPMLWWNGQSLAKESAALLKRRPFPTHRRLYLTIANEGGDMRAGVDLLAASLKAQAPTDLEWTYVPLDSETHATTFHPVALAAVRKFFAADTAGEKSR